MSENKEEGKGTINLSFAPKDIGVAVVGAYLAVTSTLNIGTASDVKKVVDHDTQVITKSVDENMGVLMGSVQDIKVQNDTMMDCAVTNEALQKAYIKLQSDYSKLAGRCSVGEEEEEDEVTSVEVKKWLKEFILKSK